VSRYKTLPLPLFQDSYKKSYGKHLKHNDSDTNGFATKKSQHGQPSNDNDGEKHPYLEDNTGTPVDQYWLLRISNKAHKIFNSLRAGLMAHLHGVRWVSMCTCVLPITMYGSRLWLYKGAAMKGPLDLLCKMQRRACLWITSAFKTSPIGAAETLAGMPPIHLHVKKLVERSHVCTCMLQASHAFRRLVDGDHKFSINTLMGQICGDLKSPVTEAWLNLDFSSLDLDPINKFNQPGLHPKDLYHGRIVYDIVSSPPKTDKDHKKFMADWINLLHSSVDAASHSPQCICIVTDTSTPSLPLQAVTVFHLWHEGDLYNDWSAAGLAMSDNAKLQAIADGIHQAYNVGLEDICQVHVFSHSANMLHLIMDVSHWSGQHLSLSICKVLMPWLRHHPNNFVHFHHITAGVDLEDHQLAHILATSTCVEVGSVPVISADFVRHRAVTRMLEVWNSLFQSKKYIGSNFLTLYQRKDTPLILTHVKNGLWMHKVRHSHSLTACLVRCTTGHTPIGAYHSRFFPEESTACRCGSTMETVSHLLYWCLSHEWESEPKEQLCYLWLLEFLEANKSMFVFDVPSSHTG
jgi:hypothetical protein